METFITGATGTIGRAIVTEIEKSGATVLLLARKSNKTSNPERVFPVTAPSITSSSAYLWQWSFVNRYKNY